MTIDYTEIETPEHFEFFARDFLAILGFTVVEGPDRGPEEGRDILVKESGSITGQDTIWLVSCKHKAVSGKAVGVRDEPDPTGRVASRADGFMGFYSTPPSSGLMRVLERVSGRIKYYIYDPALIEDLLVQDFMQPVLKRYFPASYRQLNSKLKVSTEGGYSLYAKDISFELNTIFSQTDDSLQITDSLFEAAVTGAFLARQLHSNNYSVLNGVASFNPIVWKVLVTLLNTDPLNNNNFARAIRTVSDPLQLRLLISLAGELRSKECCDSICNRVLSDGRRYQAVIRELQVLARPFFDVAKWALGRMSTETRPIIERYMTQAANQHRWVERGVLKGALKFQGKMDFPL